MGIFTELSILYSKYRPGKRRRIVISITVSHVRLISDGTPQAFRLENQHPKGRCHAHHLGMHTQTLSRSSKRLKRLISGPSWFSYTSNTTSLCVFLSPTLSIHTYDWLFQDNAALAMIERSADAWEHNQFKDVVVRAANVEMWVIADLTILLAKTIF